MSRVDPCLFYSKTVICVFYVDDCLLWSKSQSEIDKLLESFEKDGDKFNWEFTKQGEVAEFLGIEVVSVDGGFHFKQTGLIKKILEYTGMTKCNEKSTPTKVEAPLGTNPNRVPWKFAHKWNYASAVGMLLYLTHTMPDISFAVHQCARFTHGPKASHEEALLRICCYLQGDKTMGLIYKPSKELQVD